MVPVIQNHPLGRVRTPDPAIAGWENARVVHPRRAQDRGISGAGPILRVWLATSNPRTFYDGATIPSCRLGPPLAVRTRGRFVARPPQRERCSVSKTGPAKVPTALRNRAWGGFQGFLFPAPNLNPESPTNDPNGSENVRSHRYGGAGRKAEQWCATCVKASPETPGAQRLHGGPKRQARSVSGMCCVSNAANCCLLRIRRNDFCEVCRGWPRSDSRRVVRRS
jgi:hypothetical protein